MRSRLLAGSSALALACTGLPVREQEEYQPDELTLSTWNDGQVRTYLDQLDDWKRAARSHRSSGIDAIEVAGEKIAQDEAQAITAFSAETLSSVTNTQERGVDEGDLVKRVEGHLILLRRGRLFAIELSSRPGGPNRKVAQLDLTPPDLGLPEGVEKDGWYDELIVYGRKIVVIGYSYSPAGTEIVLVDFQPSGALRHLDTYFIPSFDYYSGENYSTRLIGSELFFYMPIPLGELESSGLGSVRSLPYLHFSGSKPTGEFRPLLRELRIHSPLLHTLEPVLHTLVRCPLDEAPLSCRAQAMIGPGDAELYASREAVYLWMGASRWAYRYSAISEAWIREWLARHRDDRDEVGIQLVYRVPVDEGEPGVVRVDGQPINQFSFREREGGALQLALEGGTRAGLHWVEVPLEAFTSSPTPVSDRAYVELENSGENCSLNRFIGSYLLYGDCWPAGSEGEHLGIMAKSLDHPGRAEWIATGSLPSRIEPVGTDALIVGHRWAADGEPTDLGLTSVELRDRPRVLHQYSLYGATEAEARSHAFNHSRIDERLVLGLPVARIPGEDREEREYREPRYRNEVRFFEWAAMGSLEDLGALEQSLRELDRPDDCVVSCTDWYGAARPLFLGERIFALIGYELIEATWTGRGILELDRLSALDP